MNTPRRAVPTGTLTVLRVLIAILAGTLAVVLGALFALVRTVARRVVVPASRENDTRIVGLDLKAQTITLQSTPDTRLPGRYGLFTTGTVDYIKLGSVLAQDEHTVTRKLLTEVDGAMRLGRDAAFSGWYFDSPDQLQLPYQPELIGTAAGPAPAWIFPGGDTWVIQVHGRGTRRAECLRAVPVFHDAGVTSLIVSYRNDGEAPRSRSGMYALGETEWRDVDAAIGYAKRHGAARVILMGWSMGGAIVLQAATRSAYRELIAGIVLESPVIDWRSVLTYQAHENRIPAPLGNLAVSSLEGGWSARALGAGDPIPFDRLDMVAGADRLQVPVLILASDDDGFVPSDGAHALAQARPDIVQMDTFTVARHTKLWNYDQSRWDGDIRSWLAEQGFTN